MGLPPRPGGAPSGSSGAPPGPASTSAPAVRHSPVLPPKPSGLPDRPAAPLGKAPAHPRSDEREEGEEPDELPPRRRGPPGGALQLPATAPRGSGRRGLSPSLDRDRDEWFHRGEQRGGRYDAYADERRGPPPRGRPRSRSPSPSRSFRSGRSWSRSRSRSPQPTRRGLLLTGYGGGRGGYGRPGFRDSPPVRRRPLSRSPPPYMRRSRSRSRSPPPRRFGGPPSPVYRRDSLGPPRDYGPPGRGRDFSRSPPSLWGRYRSPGPSSRHHSRSPPPGYRTRRRSFSRSPPAPPSHAPFSARSAKRDFVPDDDEEDDMIFRKSRRASHADSGGRARSRTPMSPSPPPSRGRSPSPISGPSSRRRSPSPRGGSYRHRPRSPSPLPSRSGRELPPSVPTGPRGFRPITAQQPPTAPDGPPIPTGPRSRFPQQPPRGPAALNKPAAPGSGATGFPAIPTGPKAWRTSMIVPPGPVGVPTGPSSLRQREPSPPPRRQQQEEQPPRRSSAESLASTPPPPRPSATRDLSPPPPSAATVAPPSHVAQLSHAKPVAPTPPPPPAPLSPAATAALAADREARLAQIESQRRLKVLARFLPRGAGGTATIQPLAKAVVLGPVGTEWEAEITRLRTARLALLSPYADALAASYKSDYSIIATLKEAETAREVRKLASGEIKPVFEDEDTAMAA